MKVMINVTKEELEKKQANPWLVGALVGALAMAFIPYTTQSKPKPEIMELPNPPKHYLAPMTKAPRKPNGLEEC